MFTIRMMLNGKIPELITGALERISGLLRRFRSTKTSPQQAHLRTGRQGERLAYYFLRRLGYTMVARNWRTRGRRGEIDLIGWDGAVLCFIEVKTRSSHGLAPAEAAVNWAKQRELRGMAALYLRNFESERTDPNPNESQRNSRTRKRRPPSRFDVVSVYLAAGVPPEIELFKDAFPWRSMSGQRRSLGQRYS
jgi:putative endonuclease